MEKINFGRKQIEYRIKRGNRKKSIAIMVSDSCQVVVLAPKILNKAKIQKIVLKKAPWIQKNQAFFKELKKRHAKKEYISGEQILFLGRRYRLKIVQNGDDHPPELALKGRRITILVKNNLADEERKKTVKGMLEEWYHSRATEIIQQRAKRYGRLLNLAPKNIMVRNQKKRWGSCSKNGILRFNWRISMAPVSIIDYVVVHEICHMREKNHSKNFWRQVALVIPDYNRRRQWLRKNSASFEI